MGFFKDIRNLQQQAAAMTPPEHRGMVGGMRAMKDGVSQSSQILGDLAADGQRAEYLRTNGRQGSATIQAIRDTGMTINDNPTVELELAVSIGDDAVYGVTHQQTIARIAIPSFQPGATVPVRVDPADPHSLVIG